MGQLWSRWLRRWNHEPDERGASLVLLALSMVAMLSMAAVIVDGGYAYAQRRRMQNASDAAAIAGARAVMLGQSVSQVQAHACDIAVHNGADRARCDVGGDARAEVTEDSVRFTAHRNFETFFAGVLGYDTLSTHGIAKAIFTGVVPYGNLWPVIVKQENFVPCLVSTPCGECSHEYTIWDESKEAAGNAGWLDWDGGGGGAHELADRLEDPSTSGYHPIGELVPGQPGLANDRNVRNAVEGYICKHVTVPVWDIIEDPHGANTRYRIAAFAEFRVTEADFHGSDRWIKGEFVKWSTGGVSTGAACTTGLCTIRLAE